MTDADTIQKAAHQMQKCALSIAKMASDTADAKAIKEFTSDRLKRAFSAAVSEFLEAGDSAAAAEHKARASKAYGTALADLQEQHKQALRVIETHDAQKVMFESARSLVSLEKEKLNKI